MEINLNEKIELYIENEKLSGGLGDNLTLEDIYTIHKGVVPIELLKVMLEWGISVESEHTSDIDVAREIAMDHMVEDPIYYKKLSELEEGVGSEVGHVMLDLAGLGADLAWGAGAPFDVANVIWYASEKNYLYAALSLISVIPLIGDLVGKGGKYLHKFDKMRKVGAGMYKTGKAMKSAKTVGNLTKIKSMIRLPENKEKIDKIFEVAKDNEKLKPHVDGMRDALYDFAGDPVVGAN